MAHELTKSGFPSHFFHAGMKVDEKKKIQDEFMSSKIRIVSLNILLTLFPQSHIVQVVATIAFGMGIDKSGWFITPRPENITNC